jgi:hypothetical protein
VRTENDLRAALQSLERHAPDLATVLRGAAPAGAASPGTRRPPPLIPRRWLHAAVPVMAALAVVAAVVTPLTVGKILSSNAFKPNATGGPVPANPTAAQVLNAAARVAAAQPAQAPGKYWRVSIASVTLIPAGPNAHPYALRKTLSPWTTWYPLLPGNPKEWYIAYSNARYTTTPATAGAAAQWRADGSPALPSATLPVVRTEAFSDLRFGPNGMTTAQFQALPGDPAKLKAQIEQMTKGFSEPGVKDPQSMETFGIITDLLDHQPITTQVRAAAFRILAGLPGIQMLGKVSDPVGRAGYMIGLDGGSYKTYGESRMLGGPLALVISPATGTLLAEESLAVSPSLPVPTKTHAPASGAIPGQTACKPSMVSGTSAGVTIITGDANSRPYTHDGFTYCVPEGATVKVLPSGDGDIDFVCWSMPHQSGVMTTGPLGPVVAVAPGTVTGAYVILSAGWTNATPAPGG